MMPKELLLLLSLFSSEGFVIATEGNQKGTPGRPGRPGTWVLSQGIAAQKGVDVSCLPWSHHGLRRQEQYTTSSSILLFKPLS